MIDRRLMKTKFTLLILLIVTSIAESAIIDGPANIRDKTTNRVIASLNDGVFTPDLGRGRATGMI